MSLQEEHYRRRPQDRGVSRRARRAAPCGLGRCL